jgi:hypothetical protein
MKTLQLNQMSRIEGGGDTPWWGTLTMSTVCGVVGVVAGTATLGAGFAAGIACSFIFGGGLKDLME